MAAKKRPAPKPVKPAQTRKAPPIAPAPPPTNGIHRGDTPPNVRREA